MSRKCGVPTCNNVIASWNKSGICNRCHSSLYYWTTNKKPDDIEDRRRKLVFWTNRLDYFSDRLISKTKRKVIPFRTKVRKRA